MLFRKAFILLFLFPFIIVGPDFTKVSDLKALGTGKIYCKDDTVIKDINSQVIIRSDSELDRQAALKLIEKIFFINSEVIIIT